MRLRSFARLACTAAASVLAAGLSVSASAQDGPSPDMPQPSWQQDRYTPPHAVPGDAAREAWLAECNERTGRHGRKADRARAAGECARYYDEYYAHHGAAARGYGYPGGHYGAPMHGGYGPAYGAGCCQPMMMVPVTMMPRAEPECTETVEYEYEYVDAPARPAPRRPVPDKRVKVVPDKRVKVQ